MKKSNIKKRIYQIVGITIYICIILLVGKMMHIPQNLRIRSEGTEHHSA